MKREDAAGARQRQAGQARASLALAASLVLIWSLSVPTRAQDGSSADTETWRQQDEQRRIDGRLDTLNRQLESYDRDPVRRPPPPDGFGRARHDDPTAERLDLERRNLRSRERLNELEMRQDSLDRGGRSGSDMRSR